MADYESPTIIELGSVADFTRGNSFALAWIIVAALNPADMFNTGCQLSFLSVAVLYWGASPLVGTEPGVMPPTSW